MPDHKSQSGPVDTLARKIVRLERLLHLAKTLRSAMTLPALVDVLDKNLPDLFPNMVWELLLPDTMTGEFRMVKHAEAQSSPAVQELLDHSDFTDFIRSQVAPAALTKKPQPRTRLALGEETAIEIISLVYELKLIGILGFWLPGGTPDEVLKDDLDTTAEMVGHTLQNVQTYEQLHQQNITDDLTGLFNARHFHQLMGYEIERSRRYGHDLSLVFIDLDHFKRVNDRFGHLTGSALLGEVGRLFLNNMRKINLACRYGGDEFAILLPSTSKKGASALAGKLRGVLNKTTFSCSGNHSVRITASFGIASFPGDARSKESLIQLADSAMYDVKNSGRDGIRCA